MKKKRTRTVVVLLSDDEKSMLDALVSITGECASVVVREALRNYSGKVSR